MTVVEDQLEAKGAEEEDFSRTGASGDASCGDRI